MAFIASQTGSTENDYLASTVGAAFDSATLADGSVDADSDGNRVLVKGTVLANITSGTDSGKVGPYDTGASDGRQTSTNIVGISDTRMDVTLGDKEVAYLYAGVVTEAKVYSDGVQGSLSNDVKTALRTESVDILLR